MKMRDLTKIAICIALLSVSAWISFPLPFTPTLVTAQTLVVAVIGLVLTPTQVLTTIGVYILIGAMGLPVFSGGTAGIGRIFGPGGGYFLGFLVSATLISLLKGKKITFGRYACLTIGIGIPVTYLLGSLVMSYYQQIALGQVLVVSVLPFMVGDLIKAVGAAYVGVRLNKVLPRIIGQTTAMQ